MVNTDRTWQRWGEQDPYYGVKNELKFTKAELPKHIDEFFAAGEEYVERSLTQARMAFGDFRRNRALDFGCGVGRLLLPFAKRFGTVTGMDISEAMLAEARNNALAASISNIEFVKSDDSLSQAADLYDLVNTYIVLQHIPVRRGMAILERLLELVASGGCAIIHLSIDRRFSFTQSMKYFGKNFVPGIRQIGNVLRGRDINRPTMQMNEYNLVRVLEMFQEHGFDPVLVFLEDHGGVVTGKLISKKSR